MINKLSIASARLTKVGLASAFMLTIAGNMSQANAAVFVFTDQTTWKNALSGASFETENFDNGASSFSANSTGNVIGSSLTVDLIGGVGDTGPTSLTGTGFFEGEVDSSSFTTGDGLTLNFNSNSPLKGFGILGLQNDNASNPGSLDLEEIGIEVSGESFLVSDILGLTNSSDGKFISNDVENTAPLPFLGFISDTEITSFKFLHGDFVAPGRVRGNAEEFYIDGIVTASASVPEPASILGLLAVCVFGLTSLKPHRLLKFLMAKKST